MNLLKNLMSNSKHWGSLRCFRLGSVKLACLFLGVCLCLPWRFVCNRSTYFIFFMMFALMGLFLFFLLRAYVQRKWGRLLVESLVKCLLQNFSRIKMSIKEDFTSQARQEHLLFHPVWTSVSRYFVGMQSPYHVRSCFTNCELQGACWKSRETFKCPRRCKLHDRVTEFCKTLNKTGRVQWSNWQIWQILLSSYRWLCHFRLFETCQFVSKLDSVDSRKKRCWTRASWKRHPVDLDIQRWIRMWQCLDLPGVKPLYDVNAKKARPAKCTRHHWHQDTVHVFLYFQESQSTLSEKQVWNDQCGC